MRTQTVTLDIVLPVFNEEAVIRETVSRCQAAFSPAQQTKFGISGVRFLFIDDGCRDNTATILNEEIKKGFPARVYRLSRNFGHQNAVTAGIEMSDADLVAVMDSDLQDPPEVILEMVAKWREGFEVVFGVRRNRKENFLLVSCYWFFYRILSFLSDKNTPMDSGDFCLMDRRVVRELVGLPETLRFPRGLRSWVGFRQTGLEYDRQVRKAGDSKYSIKALYQLATDGIASVSIKPLKVIQLATFSSGSFLGVGLVAIVMNVVTFENKWLYLLISFYATVTNLSLYVLAAYIGRTYLEVKGRPAFVIAEILGDAVHARQRNAA